MREEPPDVAAPWYSVPACRTVLAVARTVTTALTLLDVLPDLLGGDLRVQTLFTVMPGQRDLNFEEGVHRVLADAHVRTIPWHEAVAARLDLIVAASYRGRLDELRGPLLLLPHGPGIGKLVSRPRDGLVPLTRDPEDLTTVVLSHSEQRRHFAGGGDRVNLLAAGDPTRDRMCASLPAIAHYRRAMNVEPGARLVVLTSTWGEGSLIAAWPELASRLLGELPFDEFRVAAILHPNVWFGHSTWQIRTWLRRAIDSGLILVPPRDAWRGALVAADAVIGDHSSVLLHAAALGKPICLGAFDASELIAGTPIAQLETIVPSLDPSSALRPQIERLVAEHDPRRNDEITRRVFEHPNESLAVLRRAVYELLRLGEPAPAPHATPVELPSVVCSAVSAHQVIAEFGPDGAAVLSRFPALLCPEDLTPPPPRAGETRFLPARRGRRAGRASLPERRRPLPSRAGFRPPLGCGCLARLSGSSSRRGGGTDPSISLL